MSIPLFAPVLAASGSFLLAILGVGFLIFVHEFGHYIACRLTGTRVETFSIGFGTRLFGWEALPGQPRRFTVGRRRLDPADHAMDFRVALVPLGGYVKMAGENPGEERTGSADEFPSKPMWARVFIVSAGVIMNVIAAAFLYFFAFANHVAQQPAVLGTVAPGKAAWEAGLEPGDRILSLGGQHVRSFVELRMASVFLTRNQPADVEIERGGERIHKRVVPTYDAEAGAVQLGVGLAAKLVLHEGDRTLEIGGTERAEVAGIPVRGGTEAARLLQTAWDASPEDGVEVRLPGEASLRVPFEPAAEAAASPTWRIGIGPYGSPVVAKVRGETRHLLESGDRLLRAEGPGGAISLQGAEDLATLPFHGPIERLVVRRGDDEVVLPVSLATPAAIYAFGEDIDLENPKGTAVEPIPAGTTSPMGGSFGRYPGSPAADAGIRPGERLVRVGGSAVNSWSDILDAVHEHAGPDPLPLVVRGADGEERDVVVHPVALVPLAEGRLSLEEVMEPFETEGVLDAAGVAIRRTGGEIVGIFRVIGAFFTGNLSFQKNVAGPVTIVRASAARSEQGILSFFLFLAYISVTLAVMNVLPIPVLDGGHLMFILIEKVKGSPLKEETMGKLQTVGLMLLLVLMFFAFRNDILSLMH